MAAVEGVGVHKVSAQTLKTSLRMKKPKCSHNTSVGMVFLFRLSSITISHSSLLSPLQ